MTLTTAALAALTADEVLALWQRVETVKAARAAHPNLFDALADRLDAMADREAAEGIRADLEHCHPAAVLGAYWRQLIPDRPALGAYLGGRGA